MNRRHTLAALALALAGNGLLQAPALAQARLRLPALQLETYNPGQRSVFPVSSTLITGPREALLVDAQFQRDDAQALVARVKASGKTLTTIFISQADPDFYFGLDVLCEAFPQARIVASAATVAAIQAQMQGKLAYWGPVLKDNAPRALVVPEVLQGDELRVDGQRVDVRGLRGPQPDRSYLWVPSLRTVLGGVLVSSGIHVWTADTQRPESRAAWLRTLDDIVALKPTRVVPSHFLGTAPAGLAAVDFTRRYLLDFEREAAAAPNAAALVSAMKRTYPDLGEPDSLDISAKVIKGEMAWPQ